MKRIYRTLADALPPGNYCGHCVHWEKALHAHSIGSCRFDNRPYPRVMNARCPIGAFEQKENDA